MNILLLSTKLSGGAGIACYRQYRNLKKASYSVRILCLEENPYGSSDIASYRQFLKKKSDFKKVIFFFKEALHDRKTKKRLKKNKLNFGEFRFPTSIFDICKHPFYQWADCLNFHWVAGFLDWSSFFEQNSKPVVWSMHDMLPFSGGFHYRKELEVEIHKAVINKVEAQKRACLRGQNIHVVALSKWLLRESKKSNLFKNFPHYLIPNGLDTTFWKKLDKTFSRDVLGLPQSKKLMLFSAIDLKSKRKGGTLLLNALKLLNIAKEELGIVLLGINSHFIQNQIDYETYPLGFVRDSRLIKIVYSACDLVIVPSIEDNLPNVVLESCFCAVPVVGFNIGGLPDMIKNGVNGFLSEEISSSGLAKAIQMALGNIWEADKVTQYMSSNFSGEKQAVAYQIIFNKIMVSHGGNRSTRAKV